MYILDAFPEGKCKSIERVLANSNIHTKYDFSHTATGPHVQPFKFEQFLALSVKFYSKEQNIYYISALKIHTKFPYICQ